MALNHAYPLTFDISDFSLGWDNINSPTTLDKRTFSDIKNFNLTRRRGLEKRGGISDLYTSTAGASTDVTSLYEYKAPDGNDYVLTAVSTKIRAYFNAKWNDLKTGLTTGKKYSFETHRGLCYGVNGLDDNFKLRNTTSHVVGIAPPLGAPSVVAAAPAGASLYTNHGTANIDYIGEHRQNSARSIIAQSFKLDRAYSVSSVKLKCRKIGTPTGTMTVEIHSDQVGTPVGAASAALAVPGNTEFSHATSTKEFVFEPAVSCSANTTYYIIIKRSQTVSDTNFVEFGFDWQGSYADGQYFEIDGDTLSTATWTLFDSVDLGFEVWGTQVGEELQLGWGALETGNFGLLRFSPTVDRIAQSFKLASTRDVTSIKIPLKRFGSVTGNVWLEVHSDEIGTQVGTDSATVDIASAISGDCEWVTFTFSGTKPSLTSGETYHLILYGDYTVSTTDNVRWTRNDGYTDGYGYYINDDGERSTVGDFDFSFKIYGIYTTTESAESHALSGITQIRDLRELPSHQMIVQSFTVDESGSCPYVKVYMSKVGTPTGNIWAEIHSEQSGTSASKNQSDFLVGTDTASDNVAIATTEKAYFTSGGTTAIAVGNEVTGGSSTETADITQIILESGAWADGDAAGYLYTTNASGAFSPGEALKVGGVDRGTITADWAILIDSYSTSGSDSFNWVTFNFNTSAPALNSGSTYYLVIYGDYTMGTAGSPVTNFIATALDKVPVGYPGGTKWKIHETDEVWTEVSGQDIIFETYLTTGGLSATYYYCYTYKRTGWLETESNPSDPSASITPATQNVNVGVVASTDTTQVDKIVLYRTFAGETTPFYKQGEYANTTATISDSADDNGLTTLWDVTNTVPPKATFIKLHGDRMFYANCPDEVELKDEDEDARIENEGESLVMWSKSGNGEVVPSVNYQYFDKDDGEDITGVASVGDNFLVFKPNKIGILNTEAPELWYLGFGIGCIAPWAILTFKDKVIFLSEEGWKATDGKDIWDLSENINGLVEDGYLTINEKENYSVAYYPEKEHFQFLINHSTEAPKVIVGHFLVPLLLKPTGISELVKQNIMGWTYHEYDYDELTCIGNYTDSNGITRVIAGASDGFVYLLDSGTADDGEVITTKLQTDWLSLGAPRSITKTIRKGYLSYGTSGTISLGFTVDIDFTATDETTTLTGGDVDIENSINESFPLTGTGELFRFTLLETSDESLDLMGFTIQFRSEGVR